MISLVSEQQHLYVWLGIETRLGSSVVISLGACVQIMPDQLGSVLVPIVGSAQYPVLGSCEPNMIVLLVATLRILISLSHLCPNFDASSARVFKSYSNTPPDKHTWPCRSRFGALRQPKCVPFFLGGGDVKLNLSGSASSRAAALSLSLALLMGRSNTIPANLHSCDLLDRLACAQLASILCR